MQLCLNDKLELQNKCARMCFECESVLTTFSFLTASSQTCIPLDSSTSTSPRYCSTNRQKINILRGCLLFLRTFHHMKELEWQWHVRIKMSQKKATKTSLTPISTLVIALKLSHEQQICIHCWVSSCMRVLIMRAGRESVRRTEVGYSMYSSFVVSPVLCSVVHSAPMGAQLKFPQLCWSQKPSVRGRRVLKYLRTEFEEIWLLNWSMCWTTCSQVEESSGQLFCSSFVDCSLSYFSKW